MITKNLFNAALAILSVAFLVSCQKDMDQLSSELDQATLRSVNFTLSPKAALGRKIFFDKRLSATGTQSCSSCHLPEQGFAGKSTVNSTNMPGFQAGIGEGAVSGRFGNRRPPSVTYATFSPDFHFDAFGLEFIGGLFWDGRASGHGTLPPAAEQALKPFTSSVEHAFTSSRQVLQIIADDPTYQALWKSAWGTNLSIDDATDTDNFSRVGLSIAEFEESPEVNQFSSKFDAWVRANSPANGGGIMTSREMAGMNLFIAGGCPECHPHIRLPGQPGALFTDFGHDNIGLPSNEDLALLPGANGPVVPDAGLFNELIKGGLPGAFAKWGTLNVVMQEGAFKTPSLRNVAKGEGNKRYMHNGVFTSLKQVVNFYNTRDVAGWPFPEFPDTMSPDLGNIGWTPEQEDLVVEFLRTLSDGYTKPTTPRRVL